MDKLPEMVKKGTFDESSLEIFEGDLESRMGKLVSWVDARVKRKQWSNEEIVSKFTKRDAKTILTDGDTGFMNSCSDFTLVASALLKKNGFKPILVVEKLKQKKYDFVRMHFVLEFFDRDDLYFLEFIQGNQVLLRKGEYPARHNEEVETLKIQRIENDIRLDQNMQSVLEKAHFDLSDFHLENIITQLQKDNTPETYANYISNLSHDGNLYLDSNIN